MERKSIAELNAMLAQNELSSRELCRECLREIERLNERGPELRAVIEVNPDALQTAGKLDRERASHGPRSPLHGIPILLKDNIDTADSMQTTAGSIALLGSPAPADAAIVTRLRAAGAVVVGKANLSEWANFRSARSSSGWSSRGGQCRNPYDPSRSPCGSSSGSAAAVAAGMVPLAVGTETDGSIVCPAAMNSIVGIKPTIGLVSRRGIIPISHSQDTAGPMAATVADAALLLDVLAWPDPDDPASRRFADRRQNSRPYSSCDSAESGLKNRRIGIARNLCPSDSRVIAVFEAHIRAMERAGAIIVDPLVIPESDSYGEAEMTVLLCEFRRGIEQYLASRGDTVKIRTLGELIAFNEAHADRIMPHFGQDLFCRAVGTAALEEASYRDALELCRRKADHEGLARAFGEYGVDLLAAPSNGPAWKIDLINGDRYTGGSSSPAAVSGYPSLTLPAGYVAGLPIGTTLIGRPWSETLLIGCACALERDFPVRVEPDLGGW